MFYVLWTYSGLQKSNFSTLVVQKLTKTPLSYTKVNYLNTKEKYCAPKYTKKGHITHYLI